ncbi:hypothetical protein [Fusobacterium varium]|uniref:Uncharacterized protein n=1 Tax=Fusobacterium varium ATCC 27725 TaxID=469618 RepID=A0ABM6U8A5_FUSVA|nr:hypothetical protein [Fusobacterium varium]AVQ32598.1 hypothetical protein C4N18_15230 [Fusobacterium varium ATCC 27725]EES63544.1 hypothetical protein FVAG_02905 [Fusobacterium varium ATCC 27725]
MIVEFEKTEYMINTLKKLGYVRITEMEEPCTLGIHRYKKVIEVWEPIIKLKGYNTVHLTYNLGIRLNKSLDKKRLPKELKRQINLLEGICINNELGENSIDKLPIIIETLKEILNSMEGNYVTKER